VLAAGLGALLSGCADGGRRSTASTPTAGTSTVAPTAASPPSGTSTPALPAVHRWQASPGDLEPECKGAAVRAVERAGNGPGRSLQVIDAQYGGLLPDAASVLVVCRSWSLADHAVAAGGHTYDVRLTRRSGLWTVDAVHPSRPGTPARLSPNARRVLAHDRISLPPAARRDVRSGRVHESVLAALLEVAGLHRIGVSVVRSGHPLLVFGTTRPSDHPQGRAFDTWEIDGRAVVDPRTPRSLVTDYMHAVAAAGSYNVGGPYLLGAAPQWFSDATHHDHVHAGFRG